MTWYTIPDAPNYEINSKLVCRNKKTGAVLSQCNHPHGGKYYSLRPVGQRHTTKRSPKCLLAQARAAAQIDSFEPIPSLDNKYEIGITGKVRNAKSKLPLKVRRGAIYIYHEGKYKSVSINSLMWEVHGVIKSMHMPCPCTAENNSSRKFFENMKACARFIAERTQRNLKTIYKLICSRKTEIQGWHITYLDKDPRYSNFALADVKGTSMRGDYNYD